MFAEALGWIAASFTLLAFSVRTMIGLRTAGIAANLSFILYGITQHLYPVAALHFLLLPCNLARLYEAWTKSALQKPIKSKCIKSRCYRAKSLSLGVSKGFQFRPFACCYRIRRPKSASGLDNNECETDASWWNSNLAL